MSLRWRYIPCINLIKDDFRLSWAMSFVKILLNPSNKVVFEGPLYRLMEKVRGEQFVDIGMGEVECKRL